MKLGEVDYSTVLGVLASLSDGIRWAEARAVDGSEVVGYYTTGSQICIGIKERKVG